MASNPNTQSMKHQAGEVAGQAQARKDEAMQNAKESAQETKEQAGGFIQQTAEQARSMAAGAAEAVKNTLGMNDNSPSKPSSKH